MLSLPYYNFRKEQLIRMKSPLFNFPNLKKQSFYVEYSELSKELPGTSGVDLLLNTQLRKEFSEGASFKEDPVVETPTAEESSDE